MFGNFAKLNSPRRLVQFWQNLQTTLVLLIPNCTRQRMITYTKKINKRAWRLLIEYDCMYMCRSLSDEGILRILQ